MNIYTPLINYFLEFVQLEDVDKDFILKSFKAGFIKKNTIIEKAGHVPKLHHFIASGFVRRYYIDDFGNEIVTDINKGPEFLTTYIHFLNNTVSPKNYIETITDVTVLQINRSSVLNLLSRFLVMQEFQSKVFLKMSNDNRQRAIDLATLSAEQLYLKFINENPEIIQNVPLTCIASYLGITPQSLSRLRKNIK